MSMLCTLGLHSWSFCKCKRCGKTRHESHDWRGCKCHLCGHTRDEQHNWVDYKCSICGAKHVFPDWLDPVPITVLFPLSRRLLGTREIGDFMARVMAGEPNDVPGLEDTYQQLRIYWLEHCDRKKRKEAGEEQPLQTNRDEQQGSSVAVETAIKSREAILSNHALQQCCKLAPINPRKVGLDHLGLLRVVVYRLDGKPIDDAQLDAILMLFVTERAMTDPQYVPVMKAFTDGTFFPYPRFGFTIDLSTGSAQQRIAQCEILATTEYVKDGVDFKTTGHGLTAENVPYRIYFFWKA